MQFELIITDGAARNARLSFPRGEIETPCFMPVGTYGAIKSMTQNPLTISGDMACGFLLDPGTKWRCQNGSI